MWHHILANWDISKETSKTKNLWKQGIPVNIRQHVWPLAIGNALKITPQMFKMYRTRSNIHKLHLKQSKLTHQSKCMDKDITCNDDSNSYEGNDRKTSIECIGREESIQVNLTCTYD